MIRTRLEALFRGLARAFRMALVLGLVLLLLVYLVTISPLGQYVLKRQAVRGLTAVLGVPVRVETVRTDFWSKLDIYGIAARDSLNSILIGHVRVGYFLPAILRKTLWLRKISVEKAFVTLVRDKSGRIGFFYRPRTDSLRQEEEAEETQTSPWKVRLGEVQVDELASRYVDQALGMVATVADLKLESRFVAPDSFGFKLLAGKASFESPWWEGELDTLKAAGRLGSKGMQVEDLLVTGAGARVSASGFVPFDMGLRWNLAAYVEGEIAPIVILRRVLPELGPGGSFAGEVSWYGRLSSPSLLADLTFRNVGFAGQTFRTVAVLGRYDSGRRLRASVEAAIGTGEVEVRYDGEVNGLLVGPRFGPYTAQLRVDSVAVDSFAQIVRLRWPVRGGVVNADVWAEGEGFAFPKDLVLRAHVSGWETGEAQLADLWLDGKAQARRWQCDLYWGANSIRFRGVWDPRSGLNGVADVDLSELAIPALAFGLKPLSGWVFGRMQLFGRLARLGLQGEIQATGLSYVGGTVDTLWARVRGSPDALVVERSYFRAHGVLDSLSKWLGVPQAAGRVWLEGDATGLVPRVDVRARVWASDLSYSSFVADSLAGRFSWSGDTLKWPVLRLFIGDSLELAARGHLDLDGGTRVAAELKLIHTSSGGRIPAGELLTEVNFAADSLSGWARWRSVELGYVVPILTRAVGVRGRSSGSMRASGSLEAPSAVLTVDFDSLAYRELGPVSLEASARLDTGMTTLIGRLWLAGKGNPIIIRGTIPVQIATSWRMAPNPERPFHLQASAEELELKPVGDWFSGKLALGGRCSFSATLDDSGAGWRHELTAVIADAEVNWSPLSLSVREIAGRLRVCGTFEHPKGSLDLRTGLFVFRGEQADSTRWSGEGDLTALNLLSAKLWCGDGSLSLSGTVPLAGSESAGTGSDRELRLTFQRFPLRMANAFVKGMRVKRGFVHGNLGLVWRGRMPSFTGALAVGPTALGIGEARPDLQIAGAMLRFAGDTVRVEKLEGSWGGGQLAAGGLLAFSRRGLEYADLRTEADRLHFAIPDVLDVRVERALLRFASEEGGFRLTGEVDLGESRLTRDLRFADLMKSIRGAAAPPSKPSEFLKRLELDLALRAPQNFLVDMNLAKLRLGVSVSVSGSAGSPRYTGEVQVAEGYILYLDRKFEVTRGIFRQFDPYQINPEMDFEAVAEVTPYSATEAPTTYRITLKLSGDAEHPSLTLESDPALSQTDIVSLLTLGRVRAPREELGQEGEPGLGQILVERARALSSRQVAGVAERRIERLLNLESVTIEGNLFQLNDSWAPRVTITKRLAERLNLSYQTVVGHTNEQKIKISYRLSPFLYLDGETDEMGQAGIDLRARLRFK